ncbi:MAG: hypothetical protein U0359_37390 [Byssovorax sp.]
MLLALEELEELCAHIVKRERPTVQPDSAAIVAAYREAEGLAAGCPDDEPAAIFLALAQRSRALGPIANVAVPAAAHAAAFAGGRDLMRADVELALDRLRILRGAISWDELRGAFAKRLRPIGSPVITPPRRPR